jgi:hypothetical protein
MRKTIGFICYVLGGAAAVLALQLLIGCELFSAFSKVENQRHDFWSFVFVTDGHHRAYPNGYLVHLLRDLFVAIWAVLIIQFGRDQFVYRKKTRSDKVEMVTCPGCDKKTYAEAYCRFCGFNLVTNKPARDAALSLPVWKVSVLAYAGVSVMLLIINLLFSL